MEPGFILDSNIIIYFLHGQLPEHATSFVKNVLQQKGRMSVISQIEILSWKEDTQVIEDFVKSSIIYPLTKEVVDKTIEIRKNYRSKLPDAVIAATAIVFNCTLVTRNNNDFSKIDGLRVTNPFKS
jgi:predicted nucleic acid-binding protein